jgi:hypothetical protein
MTFAKRSSGDITNVINLPSAATPARKNTLDPDRRASRDEFVALCRDLGFTSRLEASIGLKLGHTTVYRYASGERRIPHCLILRMRRMVAERAGRRAA